VRGRISSDIWDAFATAHATADHASAELKDARVEPFEFQGEPMAPLGEWAYAPIIPTQAMGLTGGDDMEVAGTSEYQGSVQDAPRRLREDEDAELMALLVAEPLNPLVAHAVRVDLLVGRERTTAGYLPEQQAMTFQELTKSAMDIGALPLMKAHASGGTTEQPDVVVRLVHFADDPAKESVTEELIARTNERRALEHRSG